MESITIKEVDRALNIFTSTVSRALRDSYEISPETRQLVTEYAERFNYQPNPIALSLKENRSRIVGVIVPQIANNFFSKVINSVEAEAHRRGYYVFIFQTHESYERALVTIQQAVSLIGFTNTPVADLLALLLSTVEQPAREMGQQAATQLLDLIEGKNKMAKTGTVSIPTRLVVRDSSR